MPMYFDHKIFQSNEKVCSMCDDTIIIYFASFVVVVEDIGNLEYECLLFHATDNFDLNVIKCIHTCEHRCQNIIVCHMNDCHWIPKKLFCACHRMCICVRACAHKSWYTKKGQFSYFVGIRFCPSQLHTVNKSKKCKYYVGCGIQSIRNHFTEIKRSAWVLDVDN